MYRCRSCRYRQHDLQEADLEKTAQDNKRVEIATTAAGAPRSTLATALILLGIAVGLFLVWETSSSLLIIFAGVLFASFLDACARALGSFIPVNRMWRLTMVVLILTVLMVLGIAWGAGKVPEQARFLMRIMDAQIDILQQRLSLYGIDLFGPDGGRDFSH